MFLSPTNPLTPAVYDVCRCIQFIKELRQVSIRHPGQHATRLSCYPRTERPSEAARENKNKDGREREWKMITYIWSLSSLWIFCHLKNHGPWWCSSCSAGVCVADRSPGIILEFITVVFDSVCSPISRAGGRGLLSVLPCKYLNWRWLWRGSCLSSSISSSLSAAPLLLLPLRPLFTFHSPFLLLLFTLLSRFLFFLIFPNFSYSPSPCSPSSPCFPSNFSPPTRPYPFSFPWLRLFFNLHIFCLFAFPDTGTHKHNLFSFKDFHPLIHSFPFFFFHLPHIHSMYVHIHYASVSHSFQVDLVDGMWEWHLVRCPS